MLDGAQVMKRKRKCSRGLLKEPHPSYSRVQKEERQIPETSKVQAKLFWQSMSLNPFLHETFFCEIRNVCASM